MTDAIHPDDPPGTAYLKRSSGAVTKDERAKPEGGTALTAALTTAAASTTAVAATLADRWKVVRDMGAFGMLLVLIWALYKDGKDNQRDNNVRHEQAMMRLDATLKDNTTRVEAASNSQTVALTAALAGLNAKAESRDDKFLAMFERMRADQDRAEKTLARFITTVDRIEKKLPMPATP